MLLRSLLVWIALLLCGASAAQDLGRKHEALLDGQLSAIAGSGAGAAELYVLAAGLSNRQDVFRNDVETMRDLFDRHWNAAGRSAALVADEATKDIYAYPTRDNLRRAARAIGQKLDPRKDVFLLFLTSHGGTDGLRAELPDGSKFTFSGVDVRKLLQESGARYRVVVLSACHSGALISDFKDENTLVVAAAHGTRTSFGCSFTHLHTWFTEAMFEALAATPDFEQAFHAAAAKIRQREEGGEANEHSMPQIEVGGASKAKLAEIEARASKATGWQPPVLGTEAGQVRQMLGDYLSTRKTGTGDMQVRWLQLQKVGVPENSVYPVTAWAQLAYGNQGDFVAHYDSKTRTLTGKVVSLGDFRLSAAGARLVGTMHPAATGPEPVAVAFDKVPRKEVFETRARHPTAKTRANASSVIRLLYLSATDCGFCRQWERDHLAGGRLTGMPEFKHVDFVTSKRFALKDRLKKDDLPKNVAYLFDKFETEKAYDRLMKTTPAFVLLVDDQVRIWSVGTFLDSPVYPVLRAAVREKTGAAAAPRSETYTGPNGGAALSGSGIPAVLRTIAIIE